MSAPLTGARYGNVLHWILVLSVLVIVAGSFYKYFFTEKYDYLVEAPCDSMTQECYARDCETEYCPPNELALYRVFQLSAQRFAQCSDNSCLNLCPDEGTCTELLCSEQEEMTCEGPLSLL